MVKTGDNIITLANAINLMEMGADGPEPVSVAQLFEDKKIALLAVPGAFTPTCSARHLPGYEDKAEDFKAKGVDDILCLSVNDVFVMGAWGKGQDINHVRLIADGNGAFAMAMGLTMDGSGFGMGQRSQRYSMLVENGVITQLNVEAPGEFSVSSAEYLLDQI